MTGGDKIKPGRRFGLLLLEAIQYWFGGVDGLGILGFGQGQVKVCQGYDGVIDETPVATDRFRQTRQDSMDFVRLGQL